MDGRTIYDNNTALALRASRHSPGKYYLLHPLLPACSLQYLKHPYSRMASCTFTSFMKNVYMAIVYYQVTNELLKQTKGVSQAERSFKPSIYGNILFLRRPTNFDTNSKPLNGLKYKKALLSQGNRAMPQLFFSG